LALCAFATPKFVAPVEDAVAKLEDKNTEISPNLQAEQPLIVLNGQIFEIPENAKNINLKRMHEEQLTTLLNINVEDIESISVLQKDAATAKWGEKGANGVIVITTKEAKDANKETVGNKSGLEKLVKKLPGAEMDDSGNIKLNGKSVSKIILEDKEVYSKTDSIWDVVTENAQFPGGDGACFKWIAEHIRYPKLCQEFGVEGRVTINFVVEKDGSITNIQKIRGAGKILSEMEVTTYRKDHPDSKEKLEAGQDLGNLLYEEGERVLKAMPKWKPAKDKDGNVVRSRFILPISFRLNKPQEGNGQS